MRKKGAKFENALKDIIERVNYQGEKFDVKMGLRIVAQIGPSQNRTTLIVSELTSFFRSHFLAKEDINDFIADVGFIRSSQKY